MRIYPFSLLATVMLLGGCTSQNTPQSIRDLAAASLSADATDRILRAAASGNMEQLEAASHDLQLAGPEKTEQLARQFVPLLAERAGILWSSAQSKNGRQTRILLEQTDRQFRTTLRFLPADYNAILALELDRNTLNQLGYYLADRGQTREDFQLAEFLTAASLHAYSEAIGNPELSEADASRLRFERAIYSGDSLAWALFKQRRLKEARRAQESVLATIEAEIKAEARSTQLHADIPFHMAEIYFALGEKSLAQKQYRAALALQPDANLKSKIETRLRAIF